MENTLLPEPKPDPEAAVTQDVVTGLPQPGQATPDIATRLSEKDQTIQTLRRQVGERDRLLAEKEAALQDILNSRSWRLLQRFQALRLRLIPRGSHQEQLMYSAWRGLGLLRRDGVVAFARRFGEKASHRLRILALRLRHTAAHNSFPIAPVELPGPAVPLHQANVDIIVCVHNALSDVQRCLESVVRCTPPPYGLILVDDGSAQPTQDYLADFALSQGALLLRSEKGSGYTRAANRGLKASYTGAAAADYALLLNSDTIVSPGWLDRMVACGESDERIGMVGPLSNTASFQSIPEILNAEGDWAENPLLEGVSVADMAQRVAAYSGRTYPRLAFLNGFCLMLKRSLIAQVGYFDEQRFGDGYGEENDYCLRAAQVGWQLAVADDTYVYHAQSRSYSHERRKQLVERSDKLFGEKYGYQIISQGIQRTRFDRTMQGCRARTQVMQARQQKIEEGKRRWEGQRLAFFLPVAEFSGGAHVVMQEAAAMQRMGVIVELLNLRGHRSFFENAYPNATLPSIYIEDPNHCAGTLLKYDAVIGTLYNSIAWMQLPETASPPVRGYYIQDYEPGFFPPGSKEHQQAGVSYTLFPDLVRLTKTEWNRQAVLQNSGVDCHTVGASVDIDLFRPRRRQDADWPARPLRIAAMIRPSTPRRQPEMTMQALRQVARQHHSGVEIVLFGCASNDPGFRKLERDFAWRHAGLLSPAQLAALLNEVDIFADFSSSQAMGLTALEAMACGAAVIVPQVGGATSFARHEENALVIETSSLESCVAALDRLIGDEQLRNSLQQRAIFDACQVFPENAAYHILEAIFPVGT